MLRVPVRSKDGYPLMPAKASRVRRWLKEGKAVIYRNNLNIFAVQLTYSTGEETQDCVVGIDPGKLFTGVAVQTKKAIHWLGHLQLPFKTVTDRMGQRAMMRRSRRGRRINRKISYSQRNHRQVRFDNRRQRKIPPSIRANKQLELRVVKELLKVFPLSTVVYEVIKARGDKGFSPAGDTKTQVSVSNADWKRLGQFSVKKVQLLQRSTGLIVVFSTRLSNLPRLSGKI